MADVGDILQSRLTDEKAGWSMGSFGAVAEFHQDKGEHLEADAPARYVLAKVSDIATAHDDAPDH